ncbi:MAG: hypothetical protein K0Q90_1390 [Paenibacillaceae bacterium]|jgi:foldase protein PrsA|nr:hypothetical protein [Paenibacillaceae bacterium]
MEDNNKKNDGWEQDGDQAGSTPEENQTGERAANEPAFPSEGDEFGPDAFADEPAEERVEAAAAAVPAKANPLPWFLFAITLAALAVVLYLGQTGKAGVSGSAATVNGEKVTKQELYDAMYKQGGETTLDSLISEKLVAQEVDKAKVKVDEAAVETEFTQIKGQFPDQAQFDSALSQSGYTLETLKAEIRKNQEISKIFESKMDLSDAKLKEYFDKNVDQYNTPEQLMISHILVEKQEDADKILADLKAGADFATVAKEKSSDTGSKDSGGSLGSFIARGQGLDQAFEDAAFKLNKGEMSGVVQSSFGFHIIKVMDKKDEVKADFDKQKEDVKKNMVGEEVQTKGAEWLENLKKDAKIEKL